MVTKNKILILGANGMLGQDLAKVLADFDLTLWDQADIDITDDDQVKQKIAELKPNIIINAAAYTDVDGCEENKELAMKVNGEAVGYLAEISKRIDAVLFHISTDYIFNGQNKNGYTEDSEQIGPLNVYGKSKLKGEELLQEKADKFYLIRTSWLYGKAGKNFVKTMIDLAKDKKELQIVNDQFGKPTYTVDLARQILYILTNQIEFGVYHITNETKEGGISWYEFAKEIFELSSLDIKLEPVTSDQFPRPAKRPSYSSLINTKLPKMPDWQEALREYIE